MKVLLVEPNYYSRYPPLGLMKLASYHRSRGDEVKLVRGISEDLDFRPDKIAITSLFTYAWQPVHNSIEFYHNLYPNAKMEVGGIYASIMPEHIKSFFSFVHVHIGLYKDAEGYLPSYDLLKDIEKWKKWDTSILFSSRGCIRKCPFCIVPKLEGKIQSMITDIHNYVYPGHTKIVLWDNNFLASPNWQESITNLKDIGLKVDFNQGLDARLVNEENARLLADLKMPVIRMAYDTIEERSAVIDAINIFSQYGIRKRNIFIYLLYNFYDKNGLYKDTPESFLYRVNDILKIGCVAYPMRFEPNNSLKKNQYISPLWTKEKLESIADARRVIGYGGAFPPYEGLIKKISKANSFDEAFSLYPNKNIIKIPEINSICASIEEN